MQVEGWNEVMELELDDLAEALKDTRDRIGNLEQAIWLLEKRIVEVMEERGATIADTEGHTVKVTIPVTYDYNVLAGLREVIDPNLLKDCYEPAGEKVVKFGEKWNMTKAKKLSSYGSEHASIIEAAKIPGRPKVMIKNKEEEGDPR